MTTANGNTTAVLGRLDAARIALAEAKTFADVVELRDRAAAIAHYMQQKGMAWESMYAAQDLKLRAERRLGEMLMGIRSGRRRNNDTVSTIPTLSELGVSGKDSSRWQCIAGIPDGNFEDYLADAHVRRAEPTTAELLRLAKALAKKADAEQRRAVNGAQQMTCTVADLGLVLKLGKKFGTIYADPPWAYGNQGTRAATDNHYDTMTVDEIAALPVGELVADQSHLHLWTTNGFLREALGLIDRWGFEFKSTFVWVKPQLGIGNYWRCSHEIMLLGVRGGLTFPENGVKSWLEADRTVHSRKPEQVRLHIEKFSPEPRLELFGRRAVPGWVVFGNEVGRDLFTQDVETLT